MIRLLVSWLLNALALIAVTYLVPSIYVASFGVALMAALVLGLFNAILRPLLLVLTLPVTVLTLGLFIFVINGALFWAVSAWVDGFSVGSIGAGVVGAVVYSVISWVLSALLLPE